MNKYSFAVTLIVRWWIEVNQMSFSHVPSQLGSESQNKSISYLTLILGMLIVVIYRTDGSVIHKEILESTLISCSWFQRFAAELQLAFPKCNHYYVPLATTSCPSGGGSSSSNTTAIPVSPAHKEFHQKHEYSRVKEYRDQLLKLWRDGAVQQCFAQGDSFKQKLVMAEE